MRIIQLFNVCNHDQNDPSKTLATANPSEGPIKQSLSVISFLSIETESRCFIIPFAVADNK